MPDKHALLSASSSHRWLECPPSAIACDGISDRASPYAMEGTDAHALCEYKVLKALGREAPDPRDNLTYLNEEMELHTDEYCSYVMERYEAAKKYCADPEILIEQHLDFSKWVPEGFGTGDCIIVADTELQIIDFKYGMGILVDATENPQMMCYALGALDIYDGIYDIETVKMTIFQPRRGNISSFSMDKYELLQWAKEILAPTAKLAAEGKGEYKAGDHCQFCKIAATCRERAKHNLELAKYDFELPANLSTAEIADILPRIDELIDWGNDVKEYALQRAMSGTKYTGFKVVEGKSNRKYVDDDTVASIVTEAGFDPYEKKLLGITAMTSRLGKKVFDELLGGMITKPPGKPTLVPESDKRPALNSAKDDFDVF